MKRVFGGLLKATKWLMNAAAGLILLLLASWFLIPDEDLRSEVVQILNAPPTVPPQQNAYYAMWGLKADPSLDPHIVGKQIIETLKQAHAQHRKISDADLQKFWGAPQLKLDSADKDFCKTDMPECLPQIRAARARIESSERRHDPYLRRYYALRDYPGFEEFPPGSLDAPILEYSGLVALSGLVDARIALDMADQAKQKTALENLAAELRLWRAIGRNADSLITKMVVTAVLHRKFKLASELLFESPEIATQYTGVLATIAQPFETIETSLDRALIGEFRFTSSVFTDLKNEIDNTPYELNNAVNKLLAIRGFKPNATINLDYAKSRELREFYTRPATDIVKEEEAFLANQNRFSLYSPGTFFYNPVGKILVEVARPDYADYVYRLHDLSAYSRMVALQYRIAAAHLSVDEIPAFVRSADALLRNPYTDKPMHWDAPSLSLSMPGHSKKYRDKLVVRVGGH